jgi:hypothetical protein
MNESGCSCQPCNRAEKCSCAQPLRCAQVTACRRPVLVEDRAQPFASDICPGWICAASVAGRFNGSPDAPLIRDMVGGQIFDPCRTVRMRAGRGPTVPGRDLPDDCACCRLGRTGSGRASSGRSAGGVEFDLDWDRTEGERRIGRRPWGMREVAAWAADLTRAGVAAGCRAAVPAVHVHQGFRHPDVGSERGGQSRLGGRPGQLGGGSGRRASGAAQLGVRDRAVVAGPRAVLAAHGAGHLGGLGRVSPETPLVRWTRRGFRWATIATLRRSERMGTTELQRRGTRVGPRRPPHCGRTSSPRRASQRNPAG